MATSYKKEADLCKAFIDSLPEGWVAYPETGGFDILLSRKKDGFQIGVEAKLKLNAKVVVQAMEGNSPAYCTRPGPDCRAVLVPYTTGYDLGTVCDYIGLTVIRMYEPEDIYGRSNKFYPHLPDEKLYWTDEPWHELLPMNRIKLPDYIPDVIAGDSSPITLTSWKIKAIKLSVTLEKRGFLTRQDFKHFQISISRWICPGVGWLQKDSRGVWVKGAYFPDFKAQHPVNYDQIAADYEDWKNPDKPAVQQELC